ncbi:MAG: TolC family protein [Planctomycetota bacterium]
MIYKHPPKKKVCAVVALLFSAILVGCSPNFHKADADKDVYKILDEKWHPSFGQKANYVISDSNIPSPNDLKIDGFPVMPEKLTLAQTVAIATANSRTYQTQKENLYLTALDLSTERHKYEMQLFATIDGTYTSPDIGQDEFQLNSNIGAKQDFIIGDGIEIGANLAIDWARFLTGDPRTTLGSVLTATVTAPILGAGAGKQKRETLIQAEREVVYDIRTFNRFRQTFVVDTINAYYGVLQQRDKVTNAQNNYNRVLESQNRLEMEAEAGRRTRIDVDEAQQNVLRAQDSVVSEQQRYERALDDFKIRLAIPTDANFELDQNELIALKEMGVTEPTFALGEAVETALLRRLDLANTADRIDDNLRKVILAADGLGPQLNISGSSGFSSPEGETDFQNIRLHKGDYELGFDADLPLDRKNQRNAYRGKLIELERQKRQYDAAVDDVKLQVRDAYRRLVQTAEQFRIQQNSLNLANQRVESNKLLLDAGRLTVRILLDSQVALLEAENAVTAALVNHLNAKLSFYRDVGILQVKPDGMWAQLETVPGKQKNELEQDKQTADNNL